MQVSVIISLMSAASLCGQQTDQPARKRIGQVLGRPVFQDEIRIGKDVSARDDLHRLFMTPIMEKYRRQHKAEITPTEEEIVATTTYFNQRHPEHLKHDEPGLREQLKVVDDQLERDDLPQEQRQQLEAQRRAIQTDLDTPGRSFALFILKNWKFQKHLYERYGGGRILWQQAGWEAFDATQAWLETLEKRGDFQITDRELRSTFYEYWTTMDHGSFLIGDKKRIERGFLEPEWLQPAPASE